MQNSEKKKRTTFKKRLRDTVYIMLIAQSVGAVEYTDCFSAEG